MNDAREFPSRPLAGVGAVVLWRDRILLVERLHPPLAGFWSVPGGLVELGETAAEAARREVWEETGLHVVIGGVITTVDRIERAADGRVRYHYVITDFLAQPGTEDDAGSAPPVLRAATDARRARWIPLARMESLPLTPGLADVVQMAKKIRGRPSLTPDGCP